MPAPQRPRRNRPAHLAPPASSFRPQPVPQSLAPEAPASPDPAMRSFRQRRPSRCPFPQRRWDGNGLRQLLDARQRRCLWTIPYQLGVALIAELHTWRTRPTDNCWIHLLSRDCAIVRTRWRTVLVRTALRRAQGMGVEKARAAICPYRGRKLAAPVERLVRLSMAVPCASCNAPLPRAPRPPPSCTPASIDTVRASTDCLRSLQRAPAHPTRTPAVASACPKRRGRLRQGSAPSIAYGPTARWRFETTGLRQLALGGSKDPSLSRGSCSR